MLILCFALIGCESDRESNQVKTKDELFKTILVEVDSFVLNCDNSFQQTFIDYHLYHHLQQLSEDDIKPDSVCLVDNFTNSLVYRNCLIIQDTTIYKETLSRFSENPKLRKSIDFIVAKKDAEFVLHANAIQTNIKKHRSELFVNEHLISLLEEYYISDENSERANKMRKNLLLTASVFKKKGFEQYAGYMYYLIDL